MLKALCDGALSWWSTHDFSSHNSCLFSNTVSNTAECLCKADWWFGLEVRTLCKLRGASQKFADWLIWLCMRVCAPVALDVYHVAWRGNQSIRSELRSLLAGSLKWLCMKLSGVVIFLLGWRKQWNHNARLYFSYGRKARPLVILCSVWEMSLVITLLDERLFLSGCSGSRLDVNHWRMTQGVAAQQHLEGLTMSKWLKRL